MENIVIVGLGLIGGSIAKALKLHVPCHITGIDQDPAVLVAALAERAIDSISSPEDLPDADLVYLCLYPQAAIDFIQANGHRLRPGCIVTDVCGIKKDICVHMPALARWFGFSFVGGHPMAGREKSGYAASDGCLFENASYIFTPCDAPREAVDHLKELALKMGFASTVETTPEHHDQMIAFTSQVPHILACAYVSSPQCPQHKGYSAGSYRDVSRVANINETLWTELFLDNAGPLTKELDLLIQNLTSLRDAVAEKDAPRLSALLRHARETKQSLAEPS